MIGGPKEVVLVKWSHDSGAQTGYELRRKFPAIVDGSNFSEYGKGRLGRTHNIRGKQNHLSYHSVCTKHIAGEYPGPVQKFTWYTEVD